MRRLELTPTNGRKSFGNKCFVEDRGETCVLFSYLTEVAEYNSKTNTITINGEYSATTNSHINAFLEFYGFDKCSKKEMKKYLKS